MPPEPSSDPQGKSSSESALDPIGQNIDAVMSFYRREEQKISSARRALEHVGGFIERPLYLGSILLFVALWILANFVLSQFGVAEFDPPPFHWLQAIVGLGALLTATVVLIKQNRLAKLDEQREHLDLQVNLLAEQKISKLINLIEELRRDLPMVKDRHDPEAAAFQHPTDAERMFAALNERRDAAGSSSHGGETDKGEEEHQ